MTPDRRLERVMGYLEHDLQRRVEPGDVVPTQRSWRQYRGLAPHEFRRNVYNQNLWLTSLLSVGQPRDVSPQNFRCVPKIPSWHFHFYFSVGLLVSGLQYVFCATAQVVTPYTLTAESWFIPRLVQVGFHDRRSVPGASFSQSTSVFPPSAVIPPMFHTCLLSGACIIGVFGATVPSDGVLAHSLNINSKLGIFYYSVEVRRWWETLQDYVNENESIVVMQMISCYKEIGNTTK
jgi:hypothetical protein